MVDFDENENIVDKNILNPENQEDEDDEDYIEYSNNNASEEQSLSDEDELEASDNNEVEVGFNQGYDNDEAIDDKQQNNYQFRTLLAEFLYNVQKIGKYSDDKKYIKDEFCELSLRDIHRILRNDDEENPKMRLHFIKWKIIENDIIPLILAYKEDEKIQDLALCILVDVTEELKEICEDRDKFTYELSSIQKNIIASGLIEHLANLLAAATDKINIANDLRKELNDEKKELKLKIIEKSKADESNPDNANDKEKEIQVFETEQEALNKKTQLVVETEEKYQELIELIFVFFKQLVNIFNYSNIRENIENFFQILKKFHENKLYEAIIHYSRDFSSSFGKKLSITLLELMYALVRPFEITKLFTSSSEDEEEVTLLKKLREEERLEKIKRFSNYSSRPSFTSLYQIKRPMENNCFISGNIKTLAKAEKINKVKNQKAKPIRKIAHLS